MVFGVKGMSSGGDVDRTVTEDGLDGVHGLTWSHFIIAQNMPGKRLKEGGCSGPD